MTETTGDNAIGVMLIPLNGDEQYASIAKFIQHKLEVLNSPSCQSSK